MDNYQSKSIHFNVVTYKSQCITSAVEPDRPPQRFVCALVAQASMYENAGGVPSLIAVHQDSSGKAKAL
ncbi:MAG: hypothetical protein JKY60_18250, partial [Kordiimonadaceae bacterium]|nr:hypothetical protein [Kordiimonadaceae bacterium]